MRDVIGPVGHGSQIVGWSVQVTNVEITVVVLMMVVGTITVVGGNGLGGGALVVSVTVGPTTAMYQQLEV